MKKLSMLLLSAVLMATVFFAGCSRQNTPAAPASTTTTVAQTTTTAAEEPTEVPQEDITLRVLWWGGDARADKTIAVLNMYTEANPHVTFEPEFAGWGDYWDKMATYVAARSLPDIFQHDYAKILEYVNNNQLAALDPFVNTGILDLSDVSEAVISGGRFNGNIYAVALGSNAMSVLVDPEIVAQAGLEMPQPGWTWEDFEKMQYDIFDATGIKLEVPLLTDPKFAIEHNARSVGKSMFSADGKSLGFEDPSIITDFFEMSLRMVQSGKAHSLDGLVDKGWEESYIVLGETPFFLSWSNFAVVIADLAQRPLELVTMPEYSKGSQPGLYIKPSQFFCIAETSAHKEEAAKVISFFTNSIEANRVLAADRGVPIAGAVRNAMADVVSENVMMTFEYLTLAAQHSGPIDPPEPAGAPEVTTLIKDIYDEVLYGLLSPQQGAEEIIRQANAILSR